MTALARRFQFVEDSYEGGRSGHQLRRIGAGSCARLDPLARESHAAAVQGRHVDRDRLEFRGSPEADDQWANAVVVNNHFDTDGLLSIWVLLDPREAMAHRDLLVAAAEAGTSTNGRCSIEDFGWTRRFAAWLAVRRTTNRPINGTSRNCPI